MSVTIAAIYRYPVNSMGGHELRETSVQANGIPGDRCWALKDEARGGIKGGKRFASIMGMQARLDEEPTEDTPSPPATITLADGTHLSTQDADINHKLTDAVGASVSLWPLLPKDQLDHYRRSPPEEGADPIAAMREVFARTEDEPLPDLSQFPAELFTYESPPGTYFDAFPLLLMSRSSLASMQTHRSQSQFDLRRFRPNILLDGADTGFPEDLWAGRSGRIGEVELKFEMACPRCVMTTHGFDDLAKDPGIMRALVEANNGNLGVYASVTRPGRIKVGDNLEFTT